MDSRTEPQLPDPEPSTVRLSDSGEIAAAIPYLLGFRPEESVVLISLTGAGGRVGLTVRADIPPPADARALAGALARSICTDGPSGVVLAVVSEATDELSRGPARPVGDQRRDNVDLPHRGLIHELTMAVAAAGIPVRDALLVRAGRWWSYDCPHRCCRPGAGTPLPGSVTELEVASVSSGTVVARDRDELEARIAPPGGLAWAATNDAVLRTAGERVTRAEECGWEVVADETMATIVEAVAACRPGAGATRPADDVLARVLWGLRNTRVRDQALGLSLGPEPLAVEALWSECTRRAPSPLDAAPATLLAVSVWLRGDGAMANVALDRALDSDPDYALAQLLRAALASCLGPAELRAMIEASLAGDDDALPAR